MGTPRSVHILTPGTYKVDLIWRRGLCGCNQVKDLKMRLSWIIWVGPNSNDKCPYKRDKTQTGRDGPVATEAETAVMWPQAKECEEPLEAESREGPPVKPSE